MVLDNIQTAILQKFAVVTKQKRKRKTIDESNKELNLNFNIFVVIAETLLLHPAQGQQR